MLGNQISPNYQINPLYEYQMITLTILQQTCEGYAGFEYMDQTMVRWNDCEAG